MSKAIDFKKRDLSGSKNGDVLVRDDLFDDTESGDLWKWQCMSLDLFFDDLMSYSSVSYVTGSFPAVVENTKGLEDAQILEVIEGENIEQYKMFRSKLYIFKSE